MPEDGLMRNLRPAEHRSLLAVRRFLMPNSFALKAKFYMRLNGIVRQLDIELYLSKPKCVVHLKEKLNCGFTRNLHCFRQLQHDVLAVASNRF